MQKIIAVQLMALTLILFSDLSFSTDCRGKVDRLHIEVDPKKYVLIKLEEQDWHLLGYLSDLGTREMYSAALAAQMNNQTIMLRYKPGYECSKYELSSVPFALQVIAASKQVSVEAAVKGKTIESARDLRGPIDGIKKR